MITSLVIHGYKFYVHDKREYWLHNGHGWSDGALGYNVKTFGYVIII
jgi:hypothetical protein